MAGKQEKKSVKRRKFLKYSGLGMGLMIGGIFFGCNPMRRLVFETAEKAMPGYTGKTSPILWFQVSPENEIILHSSKVEMGQGIFTSFAQIAAEELEVDVNRIKVIHAETDTGNIDDFATGGSTSVASLYTPIREMAATMREMLKEKAAEKMGLSVEILEIADGVVSGNGKSMTYGEIVQGVNKWKVPKTPKLKDRSAFKYIGNPIPRVDLHDKVIGAPIFGIDASMPDMLYASVLRSRKIDAKMSNVDTSALNEMPGVVKVVKETDFIGVVAKSQIEADNARKKIKFDYTPERNWNLEDVEALIKVGNGKKTVIQKHGKSIVDLEEGELFELEFKSPIGAHAQLEPNGAIAHYKDGKVTIIMSTQVVGFTQKSVAKALGLKKKDVNIIPTFLGGGFGRRLQTPNAVQAALMSKAVGKPVKCFYDRQQEFQNDTFRPPSHHVMKGRISDRGELLAIEHSMSSGSVLFGYPMVPGVIEPILRADIGAIRGGSIMYKGIASHRAIAYHNELPFATSFWRSLGLLANTFAIESFIDELAIRAGKNPVDFRLKYLEDDEVGNRIKGVIEACAAKANYSDKIADGKAMGFAASIDAGSPCAQIAEVSIVDNQIKVHKVTAAFDCGIAVNPDQVKAQVEGCIIMGMSASLFEKMSLKDNKLFPVNFGAYKMAMMKHAPREIDVVLVEGTDKPGPVGEPPLGPIGAAIGNAVRRLTGERLTSLPLEV